jgi:hypothetical protein
LQVCVTNHTFLREQLSGAGGGPRETRDNSNSLIFAVITLPGSAESPRPVTVSMRPYKGARSVVAVKLNGVGPFDLMVDTGATVTVLDPALFDELGLRAEGSSLITSAGGITNQARSVVKEVTLDGLSAQNIAVVRMKSPVKGPDYRAVQGTDLTLLEWGDQWNGFGDTRLTTVNGWVSCESTAGSLYLGKGTVKYLPMAHCQSATVRKDSDGILPTAIFK